MNFAEQPPSKQWAALKYRGEKFADVWFKPEGEPFGLTFHIPRESFQLPGMDKQLSLGNLLKAVALTPEGVESWRHGEVSHAGMDGANPEFRTLLPLPPDDVPHLHIHVRMTPPPEAVAGVETSVREITEAEWQGLESRWKAILGLEAVIGALHMTMENLLAEMKASLRKELTTEEKIHAKRADVTVWMKAKDRIHNALPKLKDVIHRIVWANGAPERKRLATLYTEHIQPRIAFPPLVNSVNVLKELESLQKARQILSGNGRTVYQESKNLAAAVHSALTTLQSNAAANEKGKRDAKKGGKFMKDVRRATGA